MAKIDLNWTTWFYGILGAIIGGAATAVTAMLVEPTVFNFNDINKLAQMAAGGAIINLAFYLKQSPIPPKEDEPNK